jgi:hypothetical protein
MNIRVKQAIARMKFEGVRPANPSTNFKSKFPTILLCSHRFLMGTCRRCAIYGESVALNTLATNEHDRRRLAHIQQLERTKFSELSKGLGTIRGGESCLN